MIVCVELLSITPQIQFFDPVVDVPVVKSVLQKVSVGESPLCLSVHSSSVSFHRCCHCLVNDRAHILLGSRLICFVLSVFARIVNSSAGLQWLARSETLSENSPHHRVDTISFIIPHLQARTHSRSRTSTVNIGYCTDRSQFTVVAEQSACATTATAEQMQEAPQQQQQQLQNADTAYHDAGKHSYKSNPRELRQRSKRGSALIQTLVTTRQERGGGRVDTTGIGQPFMWKENADQDFGEWSQQSADRSCLQGSEMTSSLL